MTPHGGHALELPWGADANGTVKGMAGLDELVYFSKGLHGPRGISSVVGT